MNIFPTDCPTPPCGPGKIEILFDNTTNSYKYLWALAILDEFSKDAPENETDALSFEQLATSMLRRSHLYIYHYKLNLGTQDMLDTHLEKIFKHYHFKPSGLTTNFDIQQHHSFWKQFSFRNFRHILDDLIHYAPRRLLVPFLRRDISGLKDAEKNPAIDAEFGFGYTKIDQPPIYFYDYALKELYIPAQWCKYIKNNYANLANCVFRQFANFLKTRKRNKHLPNIEQKLVALSQCYKSKPRSLWQQVCTKYPTGLICPYSGKTLSSEHVLDNFIPYSFIHDQKPWNLIPTTMYANSVKAEQLPSLEKYLQKFLDAQQLAVNVLREQPDQQLIQVYEYDVFEKENFVEITVNPEVVRTKLTQRIEKDHQIAKDKGFAVW